MEGLNFCDIGTKLRVGGRSEESRGCNVDRNYFDGTDIEESLTKNISAKSKHKIPNEE